MIYSLHFPNQLRGSRASDIAFPKGLWERGLWVGYLALVPNVLVGNVTPETLFHLNIE